MDLKIKGKRALVLGASQGLGKAIAEALVKEGVRVAICSRNEQRLKATADEIRAEAIVVADLSKPGQGVAAVKAASDKLGCVDILVVNTGGPPKGKFEDLTTEQWTGEFTNLWMSTVDSMKAALPKMRAQNWGRILLVTSVAAKEAMAGLTISNGFRAGLLGLTKSISHEVAGAGVTINALLPGYTRTERLMELGIAEDKITANIPAARLGKPEEFGALAAFLASEQAAYINGQAIACDGAWMKSI